MSDLSMRLRNWLPTCAGALLALTVSGCAHRVWSDPIDHLDAGERYEFTNASNINNATTFSFIQQQFDFLCSWSMAA